MASTALKDDEITEYFDTEDKIKNDVKKLANLIRNCEHCVIYTGAGISTSAGISDFRGPNGVWTLQAKGKRAQSYSHYLMPTKCHMAIKRLIDIGLCKYLVSQNVDGLHMLSGIPFDKIAELHGNTNKEYCKNCGELYFRNYDTRVARHVNDHRTGRKCIKCGDELHDSIVNFGESLPESDLRNATVNSKKCDLAIVLGTSLRVSPACNLPQMRKSNGKLVICNLQRTPFDDSAEMVVHAKCDDFMQALMNELNATIPDFIFEFQFKLLLDSNRLKIEESNADLWSLLLSIIAFDSKNNEYELRNRDFQKNVKTKLIDESLVLKIYFNLQNPFIGELTVKPNCTVTIRVNTNKSSFEYEVK